MEMLQNSVGNTAKIFYLISPSHLNPALKSSCYHIRKPPTSNLTQIPTHLFHSVLVVAIDCELSKHTKKHTI